VPGEYTDVPIVREASHLFYERMLGRGIRIFEYQPTMMHAKTAVFDGMWSTIGSSNFDERSFRLNDEVNVNVYDRAIAGELEMMFVEDLERSVEIKEWKFVQRGTLQKVRETVAGWFKPQL